jgi:outer membrane protein assembly factor BamB
MKNKFLFAVLTAVLLCGVSFSADVKVDAAKFDPLQGLVHRANLGRTGVWKTSGVKSKPSVAWEFKTGGPVRSSPVVVDGTIYVGSYDGNFYAVDAATGNQKWSFKTGGKVSGSAAVTGGGVFFAGEDGSVYRLNAADGSLVWKSPLPRAGAIAGSPAVLYDAVFIGGGHKGGSQTLSMSASPLYALDILTGKVIWQSSSSGPQGYAAIATDGTYLYAGTGGSEYNAFAVKDGKTGKSWTGGHQARQFMSSTVDGDKVFNPATMRGSVICSTPDGKKIWHTAALDGQLDIELNQGGKFGYEIFADLAVTDDKVFAGCNDGKLYSFDKTTGKKGWNFQTGGAVQSSPSVAGSAVYFGSWDGSLYAVDTATGELLWKLPLGGRIISSPWPGDGAIYVGCDNGSVYALR